jgi:hypothetical protein
MISFHIAQNGRHFGVPNKAFLGCLNFLHDFGIGIIHEILGKF